VSWLRIFCWTLSKKTQFKKISNCFDICEFNNFINDERLTFFFVTHDIFHDKNFHSSFIMLNQLLLKCFFFICFVVILFYHVFMFNFIVRNVIIVDRVIFSNEIKIMRHNMKFKKIKMFIFIFLSELSCFTKDNFEEIDTRKRLIQISQNLFIMRTILNDQNEIDENANEIHNMKSFIDQ
jgi:hypothetical protein